MNCGLHQGHPKTLHYPLRTSRSDASLTKVLFDVLDSTNHDPPEILLLIEEEHGLAVPANFMEPGLPAIMQGVVQGVITYGWEKFTSRRTRNIDKELRTKSHFQIIIDEMFEADSVKPEFAEHFKVEQPIFALVDGINIPQIDKHLMRLANLHQQIMASELELAQMWLG